MINIGRMHKRFMTTRPLEAFLLALAMHSGSGRWPARPAAARLMEAYGLMLSFSDRRIQQKARSMGYRPSNALEPLLPSLEVAGSCFADHSV